MVRTGSVDMGGGGAAETLVVAAAAAVTGTCTPGGPPASNNKFSKKKILVDQLQRVAPNRAICVPGGGAGLTNGDDGTSNTKQFDVKKFTRFLRFAGLLEEWEASRRPELERCGLSRL